MDQKNKKGPSETYEWDSVNLNQVWRCKNYDANKKYQNHPKNLKMLKTDIEIIR